MNCLLKLLAVHIVLVIPIIEADCQKSATKSFKEKLEASFFSYGVDAPDGLSDGILLTDFENETFIVNIDTVSSSRKQELEMILNGIIDGDTSFYHYFLNNRSKLNGIVLDEFTKYYRKPELLSIAYSYDREIALNIARRFVFKENNSDAEYQIDEPGAGDYFNSNPEGAKENFPVIMKEYNLNFAGNIILSCYLFRLGEKRYLAGYYNNELKKQEYEVMHFYLKSMKISESEIND